MKRISCVVLVCISFTLFSCKSILSSYYGVNQELHFSNREEYVEYFSGEYHFDKERIYFLDSADYGNFMQYISEEGVSHFYGITLNDSLKIQDEWLNQNSSCFGRISNIIQSKNTDYKSISSKISHFRYENRHSRKIDFNQGRSIIFIISTRIGSMFNKDIAKLAKEVEGLNDPKVNYYLIAVDPIAN